MAIYKYELKNGDVRYEVSTTYRDSLGRIKRIHKRGFTTRDLARDYEAKLRIEKKKTSTNILLWDAIQDFLDYKDNRGLKERTIYDYTMTLQNQIYGWFGNVQIRSINVARIKEWQQYLMQSGSGHERVRKLQMILNQLLRYCVMMEYLAKNPFDNLEYVYPKAVRKQMEYYTLDEYKRFRSAIDSDMDRLIFDTLYFTGMRKGELLARRWRDIDFREGTIYIHSTWDYRTGTESHTTKTGETRTIYLNDLLIRELKQWREDHPDTEFILEHAKGSKPIDKNILPLHRDRIIAKYNAAHSEQLKTIRIHDFRHSHVSLLINNGLDSFRIAERLGHSKDMVERRYGHLFPERKKEILNIINVDL